jgi:hypothetical protein
LPAHSASKGESIPCWRCGLAGWETKRQFILGTCAIFVPGWRFSFFDNLTSITVMLLRHRPHARASVTALRRPGKVALVLLMAAPSLLLAIALAFYAAELVEVRTLLRNDTDAAALAGVQSFIHDDLLRGDPTFMQELIPLARQHAQQYAELNLVFGQGLYLDPNVANDEDGDIVVGTLATPRSKTFVLPNLTQPSDPEWLSINTVRVTGRRSSQNANGPVPLHNGPYLVQLPNDAVAVSTATLDRFLIGFRPLGGRPLPLCPLALFTDPSGMLRHSWEYNVEKRRGRDMFKVRRNGPYHQILGGADGLHEMEVFLGTNGQLQEIMKASQTDLSIQLKQGKFNCCMLQFGTQGLGDLAQQIVSGVYDFQLSQLGGQLVLGAGNLLEVNGTPWGPLASSFEGEMLQNALKQLQSIGKPLVWPCFSFFDKGTSNPVLCGFVAARVVQVKSQSGKGGGITFSVQPCMMSTATAVTDPLRAGVGLAKLPNPYICKVRLVE